jgi:Uma2 family endonuclease
VELKSKSDSIQNLKEKMNEWMSNGCMLGWLIDVEEEVVYVYTKEETEIHRGFDQPI